MLYIGFGTFCTSADGKLSTNHTFQIKNLTFEKVQESFQANLRDFFSLLDLCKKEGIEVFRLGSNFIPYASHSLFRQEWLSRLEPYLIEAGDKIKQNYNIRITMHPGQFTVLNSPKIEVLENSLRELKYHFWVLDTLGIGQDGIVIIHVGGIYGDKKRAIERFINNVDENKWLKRRLAIENDEKIFTAQEVLDIAKTLEVPFVFDLLHHKLNPSRFSIEEIFKTWNGKGIPKFHLSSMGKGKKGIHGEYVNSEDFMELIEMLKSTGLKKVHLMIEAKQKERAIKRLKEQIEILYR